MMPVMLEARRFVAEMQVITLMSLARNRPPGSVQDVNLPTTLHHTRRSFTSPPRLRLRAPAFAEEQM